MKHLLNGVAIAAVLALATPVLAQNAPMTPSTPPKAAPAPAPAPAPKAPPPKAPPPMATKKPPMHHMAMRHHAWNRPWSEDDKQTEELNRQELARITGGAPPPPPPAH